MLSGGISDVRTKVKANANDLDVVELYGGYCDTAAKEGLLVPLDYSKIPNAAGIPENLRHEYWVGFTAYSTVLAYNTDVYGNNPPKNWADFFDVEKFPGTRAVRWNLSLDEHGNRLDGRWRPEGRGLSARHGPVDEEMGEFKPNITVKLVIRRAGDPACHSTGSRHVDDLGRWIEAAIKEGAPYAYTLNDAVMDVECLVVPERLAPIPKGPCASSTICLIPSTRPICPISVYEADEHRTPSSWVSSRLKRRPRS